MTFKYQMRCLFKCRFLVLVQSPLGETVLMVMTEWWLLSLSGWRPGRLLGILLRVHGMAPVTGFAVREVDGAKIKNARLRLRPTFLPRLSAIRSPLQATLIIAYRENS